MRFELFLGISILLLILAGWGMRFLSRREVLIRVLFLFAVISYLFHHFTGSRTV
jgi:hypothetical protein